MGCSLPRTSIGLKGMLLVCLLGILSTAVFGEDHPLHDIHISVCEVRYNAQAASFQVSLKIFIDDFERAMSKEGAPALHIGGTTEIKDADSYIGAYLNHHFTISLDDSRLVPILAGKELSDDYLAVWCYFEYPAKLSGVKHCSISNDVLFALYEDQRNIMDIRMNSSHKDYMIFQPGKSTWSYSF